VVLTFNLLILLSL